MHFSTVQCTPKFNFYTTICLLSQVRQEKPKSMSDNKVNKFILISQTIIHLPIIGLKNPKT